MANIVFQYSTLCILSLFIGIGLCTKHQMILFHGTEYYAAFGSVAFGHWFLSGDGRLVNNFMTGDGNSYVLLSLYEEFEPSTDNLVSIGDDSRDTGSAFKVTNVKDGVIRIPVNQPPSNVTPTFNELVEGKEQQLQKKAIIFKVLEFIRAEGENVIKCIIAPGDSGQPYPDVHIRSPDSAHMFFGYLKDEKSKVACVRILGIYASDFNKLAENVQHASWNVYKVNKNGPFHVPLSYTTKGIDCKDEFVIEIKIE